MRNAQPPLRGEIDGASGSFALVAEDVGDLRWLIDPGAGTIRQADGEVEMVVIGTAEDLVLMLSGEVNPGILLRSGRIRHLTARDDVSPEEVAHAIQSLLEVLKKCCMQGNGFEASPAAG